MPREVPAKILSPERAMAKVVARPSRSVQYSNRNGNAKRKRPALEPIQIVPSLAAIAQAPGGRPFSGAATRKEPGRPIASELALARRMDPSSISCMGAEASSETIAPDS